MKDKLDRKIVTKFFGLRTKTYSYLTDGGSEDKKVKGTKKCLVKKNLNLCGICVKLCRSNST